MIWIISAYLLLGVVYMEAAQVVITKYYGRKYSTFAYFIATPIWGYFLCLNLFTVIIAAATIMSNYPKNNEEHENRNG
jgi:hypothetical protein